MPKDKKDYNNVTFSLKKDIIELLSKYSDESFIPKTRIVEEAIKEYITKRNKKA